MKRIGRFIVWLVLISLVFGGCAAFSEEGTASVTTEKTAEYPSQSEEIRAVWISYLDLSMPQEDNKEASFYKKASEMVRQIRNGKINTVFLHVRPFSDAIYRSNVFPYSACISGTEGADPGYDALEIFCNCAKKEGMSVHAWINPFRIGNASKLQEKSAENPARRILSDDDPANDSRIVEVDGMLYYDPANQKNQDLILEGIHELLQVYAIDGIHIDDYFYPTTEDFVDQSEYDAYLVQCGTESRDNWRRAKINMLVSRIYKCVKSYGNDKIFSISPALRIEKNRLELFADVTRWLALPGYCDWMIPQVYVGFEHETYPFCDTVDQWAALKKQADVRLLFGLAAYKCGDTDAYAGRGQNEWTENTDILSRQIRYLRSVEVCDGFAFFSYSSIFGRNMSQNSILEMKSVISML